jgi:ubiquinone/menaquinone biosynthesis C-methylase UbiE
MQPPFESFKSFEHDRWQSAVEHYDCGFTQLTSQVIAPLLAALDVATGERLLDVACGPGYLAAEAHRRGASVLGIDFSAQMLVRARSKFPSIEFVEGDAESLPLASGSISAVAMNFGILHLEHPDAAIGEAFRVLAGGGRFAFSVWAPPQTAMGFGMVLDAISKYGDKEVTIPAGPPFFRFSDLAEGRAAMMRAGFTDFHFQQVPFVWRMGTPQQLFDAFLFGTARTGGLLRAQPESALQAIRSAVEAAVAPFTGPRGLEIPMPAIIASGRKP